MTERIFAIGTLGEKPLHASLKRWYALPGDLVEVPVNGYVIDLVRGELLVEIQTRGFSSMKRKVLALLELGHAVRVVHPIAVDRWIVKVDAAGEEMSRRRSPSHGTPSSLFVELVSFPELLMNPRFEIEVIMTNEEEIRSHQPGKSWRRNGWTVEERRLVDVVETRPIRNVDDLAKLLPADLPDPFTTADLADRGRMSRRVAQQMTYCLRLVGAVIAEGKTGNASLYRIAEVGDHPRPD